MTRAMIRWFGRPGVPMLALLSVLLTGALLPGSAIRAAGPGLPSLQVEDLTWTEVADALSHGYDTVIVPTGGTEQNGPHAILGKHNYVVGATAERIARELGGTLVAPVIAYVPEGEAGAEPTGHMRWPGTISVSDDVFAALLVDVGRSFATHGFRRILFIGDSGGNQTAQARAADRLNAEWRGSGTQALNVTAYYAANGQVETLEALGFARAEIGTHAALRDTSELLAVRPGAVRAEPLPPPDGRPSGHDGAPAKATAGLGSLMLDLKVAAALRQIRTEAPAQD